MLVLQALLSSLLAANDPAKTLRKQLEAGYNAVKPLRRMIAYTMGNFSQLDK
jgi:hypothetical protein